MKAIPLLFTLFVFSVPTLTAQAVSPRITLPFDQGWRFKTGELAASAVGFDDTQWEAVVVPHVFPLNGDAKHRGEYHGEAWYRKSFAASPAWKGKRVFLRFDAVSMTSDTYLNGEKLGEHRGGFAAFTYEITDKLKPEAANEIAVRVDDRWNDDVSPLEQSLLHGGMYRHISLIVTGPVNITPMDYSSPGVFLWQRSVTKEEATVEIRTEVNNATPMVRPISVRLTLMAMSGEVLASDESHGDASPGHTVNVVQSLAIPHPHLWSGVADPYLYRVRMDLLEGTKVVDSVTQPLGLRFFRFDAKTGFSLNGVRQQIRGVCLHQDWGSLGWAVEPPQEAQDLEILREMGVDGLRLVHYQHGQSALDLYDRTGMLVWSELAQFGKVSGSEAYRQNVRQQLTEMIRQNFNHPSILMWSLYNELHSDMKVAALPIVQELNAVAHREDPSRPTVAAGSGDTIANAHELSAAQDLIGDNNYAGWYYGKPEDLDGEIKKWNAAYGDRGLGITEYGGGAKIEDHRQNLSAGDVQPRGPFQPEEWQAAVHEGNYRAIRKYPYVWGGFIWLSFDSGGRPRGDGSFDGGNIKGLVTQDRKVRKDAYFFYQANWTTKPMIYLTSRRAVARGEAETPVKVYSNATRVSLSINGTSLGEEAPDDQHVFVWKNAELKPGLNRVEVFGTGGLHDEATWLYTPAVPRSPSVESGVKAIAH